MALLPEKRVENAIHNHMIGVPNSFIKKLHNTTTTGKAWLDFVGAYRGVPFWIEIKAPNGKPTNGQVAMVGYLKRCGYVTGIVSSVDEFTSLFKHALSGCYDLDYLEEKQGL